MNRTGRAKMMSSRNNNFSNRGQKFKLNVYQKLENTPNTNTNLQTSNGDNDTTPVIGIVAGFSYRHIRFCGF